MFVHNSNSKDLSQNMSEFTSTLDVFQKTRHTTCLQATHTKRFQFVCVCQTCDKLTKEVVQHVYVMLMTVFVPSTTKTCLI